MKCRAEANNHREAVVVSARLVVKRPRIKSNEIPYYFLISFNNLL